MSYIVGVDIGTSGTKALAYTPEGKVKAVRHISYPLSQPYPGYSEQDPQILLKATISCIRGVVGDMKSKPEAVSFSAAMHGLMAVDKKGRPLTPLLTWADTRSGKVADTLKKSPGAGALYRRTGTPIHPMSPLCKLIWMREHQHSLFKQASKFISIKEYIFFHCFGQYVVDHSIASATGLFDIVKLQWLEQALELAGIPAEKLSVPLPTTTIFRGFKNGDEKILGLDLRTPFVIGASDGCLANLGTGAMGKRTMSVTVGTSGAVRLATSQPLSDSRAGIFNYILTDTIYIAGGPVNSGGIVLEWFKNTFMPGATIDEVIKIAMKIPPGCEGLLFLPYIQGERAPVWDGKTRGVFTGVDIRHTSAHFARAVLEGICLNICFVQRVLEQLGIPATQIRLSGGIIKSTPWSQLMTDILQRKTVITADDDASATGAAMLGLIALGQLSSFHAAGKLVHAEKILMPGKSSRKDYGDAKEKFQGLVSEITDQSPA
jgi:gluconokinase